MKFFLPTMVICLFVTSISFGKNITAKKIKVILRSASVEMEIAPILLINDSNNWRKVDQTLRDNAKYENKSRKFKIESGKEEPDAGDLARYRFYLIKESGKKELLSPEPISGVDILAGGDFLLIEPLTLINTSNWERIDLAKAAHIEPYFSVIRYSSKSNKILVAQFDCAFDCPKEDKTTIWELSF